MRLTGMARLLGAAAASLGLLASPAQARTDGGLDDLMSEYRPVAYAPAVLPVFPLPTCDGGEVDRAPSFIAGDGTGDFAFVMLGANGEIESFYRLKEGEACVDQLPLTLPLAEPLERGTETCNLVSTQELVALPQNGVVLHNLSGLTDSNLGCFVAYRVDLATGERTPILDSSVLGTPLASFNPSPYSAEQRRPVFTTENRLGLLRPDGSFEFETILRARDPVPTPDCPTAIISEFRARPAVSGNRILATAEFDEDSCQLFRNVRVLVGTYDEDAGEWGFAGANASEPGSGDEVLPSTFVGHPDFEIFLTNGINQTDFQERIYSFDVSADGTEVAANPIEDLYADVGETPDLLRTFRTVAPGYTASGQPLMLGVGGCKYRGVERDSGCLIAIGPAPGTSGAQANRRLAKVVGWGRDVPGYRPGRFVNVRFAGASGRNVLLNIDAFDVDLEYFGRSFQQLTLDTYRPTVAAGGRLRFARPLGGGRLRVERLRPTAKEPLSDPVHIRALGRGFVPALRPDEETVAGVREASVTLEIYGADGALANSRRYPQRIDTRALIRFRDFTGNGSDEIGVAGFDEDGRTVVTVKDGRGGKALGTWNFPSGFRPEFAAVTDDLNGNGAEEFAILGVNVDGRVRAHVRDGRTGETLTRIEFGQGLRPVGFAAVPNRQGQRRWLSVLTTDNDGRTTALTRNTGSGGLVGTVDFGRQFVPVAFAAHTGAGAGAALAVAGVAVSGQHRVLLKDAASGETVGKFFLPRQFTPVDLTEVKDFAGDGVADLLVVGASLAGDIQIQVRDPVSGRTVKKFRVD